MSVDRKSVDKLIKEGKREGREGKKGEKKKTKINGTCATSRPVVAQGVEQGTLHRFLVKPFTYLMSQ